MKHQTALDANSRACENHGVGESAVQYVPGQQLPGTVYRVVRHLATGGMGSVYDVEDVTVGKRYVLKTLHPQLVAREDLAKRMEAEARTLAKLQHPNIVDVVTAGLTTDSQRMPFYVMERLNGQNLRVVIEKKGSLEIAHCYRIAIDVLDALEHAHENAVIHRDVKPDNIFLHRNANGTTTTKLLDFGIMRLLDRKVSHTQGKFIGTLRYASPEQIFGGELGPATDIYSLGVVLYEMIAGRGPFDEIGDAFAIGAAHAQRPAPPVSQFAPSVPRALEQLVMAALAKEPRERPRDCFSFAGELRRLLRDEEAAPKSATAIAVLSAAPPNTAAALPLAGTEMSPSTGSVAGHVGPTDIGMPAPSALAMSGPGGAALPPTVRQVPGGSGASHPSRGSGMTAMGVAATLASEPGGDTGRSVPPGGSVPGAKPAVDRAAETRASGISGFTQRLAANGTAMDLGAPTPYRDDAPPVGHDTGDAVRAALAQREPLEVPPTSGHAHDIRGQELVLPTGHGSHAGYATGTGPLAGEALTRPPERSLLLPLLGAAGFGALLVGGAVLFVTKPWDRHASAPPPPPAASAALVPQASARPAALTTAASASASASASAPAATPPAPAGAAASPLSPSTRGAGAAAAAAARTNEPRAATPPAVQSPAAPAAPAAPARKPAHGTPATTPPSSPTVIDPSSVRFE